jgi:hypothetical protein
VHRVAQQSVGDCAGHVAELEDRHALTVHQHHDVHGDGMKDKAPPSRVAKSLMRTATAQATHRAEVKATELG